MHIRTAVAALALAATATTGGLKSCQPTTAPPPATTTAKSKAATSTKPSEAAAEHSDGAVEFDASCDQDNHAFNVKPNTKKAKAAAEKMCQNTGKAIDEAPWPSGYSVIPLPPELVKK